MPICLNLLAETQAVEESRRRDPVKRAIWVAALLVSLMLVWSSSLQLKTMLARSELSQIQGQVATHTNAYQQVLNNQSKAAEVKLKLADLGRLASSRFLNGPLLNALQQTTVEDVQLIRLKTEQRYVASEETKAGTNAEGRVTAFKPATITERIVVTLEAKDSAPNPGDQVNRFMEAVTSNAYFQTVLGRTGQVQMNVIGPPQAGPDGRPFRLFTLECRFPERTR